MQGGDISNDAPASVLVNLDVLLIPEVEVDRFLGIFPRTRQGYRIDVLTANAVHRVAERSSLTWEGFGVGLGDERCDQVAQELERMGVNPFRWVSDVPSIDDLMSAIPYRRNVLGIIDRPQRALMYGSLYLDLDLVHGR